MVTFVNEDEGIDHNLVLLSGPVEDPPMVSCNGPCQAEVEFTAPAAGEQGFFVCFIHPGMFGLIAVE